MYNLQLYYFFFISFKTSHYLEYSFVCDYRHFEYVIVIEYTLLLNNNQWLIFNINKKKTRDCRIFVVYVIVESNLSLISISVFLRVAPFSLYYIQFKTYKKKNIPVLLHRKSASQTSDDISVD